MSKYHKEGWEFNQRRAEAEAEMLAPGWAEATAPRNYLKRLRPSLLLIEMPEGDGVRWQVATLDETNAVADPVSRLGRLLRPHCALMSLPYISEN